MIVKSWGCLNRYCLHTWDTFSDAEAYPTCPHCEGIKVKWIPKPFGIKSERTKQADRDVASLTEVYGDKNYRSPRRGESAAPRANPIATPGKTVPFSPMQGWRADVPVDRDGNIMTHCAPTGVTAKVSATLGQRVGTSSVGNRRLGVGAKYEAVHRPGK